MNIYISSILISLTLIFTGCFTSTNSSSSDPTELVSNNTNEAEGSTSSLSGTGAQNSVALSNTSNETNVSPGDDSQNSSSAEQRSSNHNSSEISTPYSSESSNNDAYPSSNTPNDVSSQAQEDSSSDSTPNITIPIPQNITKEMLTCPSECSYCAKPSGTQKKSVEVTEDVLYGEAVNYMTGLNEDLIFDIHTLPKDGTKRPVMIFIHGGGFAQDKTLDTGWSPHYAKEFASRGFFAVNIEYRAYGATKFGGYDGCSHCKADGYNLKTVHPVHDVKSAIRYLRKHADELELDPNRIGLWGCSAGAITAANTIMADYGEEGAYVGEYSSEVSAAISLSGKFSDFTHAYPEGTYIPPYLAIHNTKDDLVPYETAVATKDFLDERSTPNGLIILDEPGHCPDVFTGISQNNLLKEMIGFLTRTMQIEEPHCPTAY